LNQDSEIECPSCGEAVYQELFACPNCGLVFHPLEDEDEVAEKGLADGRETEGFSLGAAAAGWVVSAGIAFLFNVLVGSLWPVNAPPAGGQLLLFLAGPLGALAGGALAAHLASGWPLRHGLAVACASLASAYLLEAVRRDLTTDPLTAAALFSWALILAAGPLGAWLPGQLSNLHLPSRGGRNEKQLYNTLLMRVRYDPATAERLIEFERRRLPTARRAAWIENAIERLDHDRR
jgi:hypothetical protein